MSLRKLIRTCYINYLQSKNKSKFAYVGEKSVIGRILRVQGGENIYIGNLVSIHESCWLAALPLTGEQHAELRISDKCVIGDYNHIWATKRIVIEESVLTANHVYISDNLHAYDNVDLPIVEQPIVQLKEVKIGSGSWLGENVCIIGASIGRNCVIGANSVVTHDIPDYSVAVGVPARIIKRYNFNTQQWEKTKKGDFIT